jgi:hypothetical protein
MIFRTFAIFYGVGLFLSVLGLVEWLIDRASGIWARHLKAAVVSEILSLAVWIANRRRFNR